MHVFSLVVFFPSLFPVVTSGHPWASPNQPSLASIFLAPVIINCCHSRDTLGSLEISCDPLGPSGARLRPRCGAVATSTRRPWGRRIILTAWKSVRGIPRVSGCHGKSTISIMGFSYSIDMKPWYHQHLPTYQVIIVGPVPSQIGFVLSYGVLKSR